MDVSQSPDVVQAPAPVVWEPGGAVTVSPEAMAAWQARVDRAYAKAKSFHPQWDRTSRDYALAKVPNKRTSINALKAYRHVETKKAHLFFQTPEVTLVTPPGAEVAPVVPSRATVLNYELGPMKANATRALHVAIVEALAASGWLVTKIGYEQVALPDPVTGARVPVWSRRFWSSVSGKKLLVPAEWSSTNFDEAPWLGVRGVMPVVAARRMGWTLPEDFEGRTLIDPDRYTDTGESGDESVEAACQYTEIWYKASHYDADVFHPDLYRCLILVEGLDTPAWCVNSAHQMLTPTGALTDDSLMGNPIHVGTLRDLPDSAYVPSDLLVGEQLTSEIDTFRTDLIRGRRARKPLTLIDSAGLDEGLVRKIERNEGPILVPAGWLAAGKDMRIVVVNGGPEPRDNYTAQDYAERDLEEALGIGSNQAGTFAKGRKTATEVRTVQGRASAREQTEQNRVRDYFIAGVRKFDAILSQTMAPDEVVKILGPQAAAVWEQWRALPGQYGYQILPDAGQYVDAREFRQSALETYNLLRKDDRVNAESLLQMVAQALHRDPTTFIAPPSDKTTEPPAASIAFNPVDLNDPIAGRMFLDLAANGGVKISPDTIQMMAAAHRQIQAQQAIGMQAGMAVGATSDPDAHGGAALRTEKINQHASERTGRMQGNVQ